MSAVDQTLILRVDGSPSLREYVPDGGEVLARVLERRIAGHAGSADRGSAFGAARLI